MLSKMLRRATLLSLLHHPSLSRSPCPRTWTWTWPTLLFFFGPSSSSPFSSSSSSSPFGAGVEKACSMGSGEQEEVPMIKEGQAKIHSLHGNSVFYNKTQIVNRDLSIAVLQAFASRWQEEQLAEKNRKQSRKKIVSSNESEQKALDSPYGIVNAKDLRVAENHSNMGAPETSNIDLKHTDSLSVEVPKLQVLEALSASGLRALRYACEVEGVGSVVALDNDPVAHEACKKNIELNGPVAISKVQANIADARVYMLTHEKQFDVVDLDPYGSPSIFLDSAVQTVAEGGLLMCTATDMAVLCGNNGEVCYSKYGSYPLRGKYCHEMALRMLLASIESHANRYKRHIVPLLSLSVDFYIRVFVRIYTSANEIKASPSKLSYVYQCVGCDSYHLQPVGRISNKNNSIRYLPGVGPTISPGCKQCGKYFNMGGPIWSEPIHDSEWVSCILNGVKLSRDRYPAYDKVHSILTSVSEELLDVPLFLSPHSICATLKCTPPPSDLFRYAIVNAGYRVSGTHANPLGVKTDASMDAIWDIMRCWVKLHPVKAHSDETPATFILSKEPSLQANFSKVSTALSKAKLKGMPRFLPNPEGYWGPKPRAGRQITSKHANLFQSPAILQKNLSELNYSNGSEQRAECCEQPSKTMNSTHDVEIK